jgi:hypothetical protein
MGAAVEQEPTRSLSERARRAVPLCIRRAAAIAPVTRPSQRGDAVGEMRRELPFGCPLATGLNRIQTGPKELYAIDPSAISKEHGGLQRQQGWEPSGAHESSRAAWGVR